MNLIMLGAPGAGKGTHGHLLQKKLNIPIVSTGDILRRHIHENDELGKLANKYIKDGKLVPDDVIIEMIRKKLSGDKHNFIFDGFPRTLKQAKAFNELLDENDMKLDKVINLSIPDEVIVKRMASRRICPKCGETYNIKEEKINKCKECGTKLIRRKDDEEETVRKRIKEYHKKSQELIEFYEDLDILINIDSTLDIDDVHTNILKALEV